MEYQTMSEANFNLVLHHEARFAAEDFHNRLQIPFIELRRLYQIDKIENQYHALGNALGVAFCDEKYKKQAEDALEKFRQKCPDASFAIGECLNADPFELSLAFDTLRIFCTGNLRDNHGGELHVHSFSGKNKSRDESIFQYGTDDDLL